jgi:Rieske Fe-S protein
MPVYRRRWVLSKLLQLCGLAGLLGAEACTLESTAPFCEQGPRAQFVPPLSDLVLFGGDEFRISWVAECVEFLQIEFSRNQGANWSILAAQVPAKDGFYVWEVPQIATELAQFRLIDTKNKQVLTQSTELITLIPILIVLLKDHPTLSKIGGVLSLEREFFGPISIIRTEAETFKILSLNCTHNGCPIETNNSGESWECPCHGSQFSKLGCVLQGPAQRPLPVFRHEFNTQSEVLTIYNLQNESQTC